ncbi:hypothetical protein L1887_55599 [Cichorium endivia]|nr:hypothetical protein L1887_55599 [Cichorium endivia]
MLVAKTGSAIAPGQCVWCGCRLPICHPPQAHSVQFDILHLSATTSPPPSFCTVPDTDHLGTVSCKVHNMSARSLVSSSLLRAVSARNATSSVRASAVPMALRGFASPAQIHPAVQCGQGRADALRCARRRDPHLDVPARPHADAVPCMHGHQRCRLSHALAAFRGGLPPAVRALQAQRVQVDPAQAKGRRKGQEVNSPHPHLPLTLNAALHQPSRESCFASVCSVCGSRGHTRTHWELIEERLTTAIAQEGD